MKKTNKENFQKLVSKEDTSVKEGILWRKLHRARLRESQNIALKVLSKLDELGWSQRMLASKLGVSPQQVTKIVKGKENLTIETQVKIQTILDIPILATYYEKSLSKILLSIKIREELRIPENASKVNWSVFNPERSITKTVSIRQQQSRYFELSA